MENRRCAQSRNWAQRCVGAKPMIHHQDPLPLAFSVSPTHSRPQRRQSEDRLPNATADPERETLISLDGFRVGPGAGRRVWFLEDRLLVALLVHPFR